MRTLKTLTTIILFIFSFICQAQSEDKSKEKKEQKANESASKGNSSQETITKIIRVKGANGEEKIIKHEQVITKKSKIKLNDNDKTNMDATYMPEEVSIENSSSTPNTGVSSNNYSKVADGKGYILTLPGKNNAMISKARPLSNGYFLVHLGDQNNCLGHFDEKNNLILEMFDTKTDKIISKIYKLK